MPALSGEMGTFMNIPFSKCIPLSENVPPVCEHHTVSAEAGGIQKQPQSQMRLRHSKIPPFSVNAPCYR